jgi:predicted HTH domain antitoxin
MYGETEHWNIIKVNYQTLKSTDIILTIVRGLSWIKLGWVRWSLGVVGCGVTMKKYLRKKWRIKLEYIKLYQVSQVKFEEAVELARKGVVASPWKIAQENVQSPIPTERAA